MYLTFLSVFFGSTNYRKQCDSVSCTVLPSHSGSQSGNMWHRSLHSRVWLFSCLRVNVMLNYNYKYAVTKDMGTWTVCVRSVNVLWKLCIRVVNVVVTLTQYTTVILDDTAYLNVDGVDTGSTDTDRHMVDTQNDQQMAVHGTASDTRYVFVLQTWAVLNGSWFPWVSV